MSVVGFPTPPKNPTKRLDEIEFTATPDLGKPYIDVNDPLDGAPPGPRLQQAANEFACRQPSEVHIFETRQQMNDSARYKEDVKELSREFERENIFEPLGKDGFVPSPAAKLLQNAASLIDGDRHHQHGDRHENFGTIAAYWTVLFGFDVQAWQVARAFELAKIARDVNGSANEDNAVDAAAYSALSWELRNNGC